MNRLQIWKLNNEDTRFPENLSIKHSSYGKQTSKITKIDTIKFASEYILLLTNMIKEADLYSNEFVTSNDFYSSSFNDSPSCLVSSLYYDNQIDSIDNGPNNYYLNCSEPNNNYFIN